MSNLAAGPWKKIGLHLSGPYGSNNEFIFAAIDYYSRFPTVEIIKSTTSTTIINRLRQILAMHGFVDEIVTDNASYFVSSEFKAFLHENGIKHSHISPYWSQNNGLVVNFNKSTRKAVRTALVQIRTGELKHTRFYYITGPQNTLPPENRLLSHCTTGRLKLNCLSSITKKRRLILKFATHCKSRISRITQTGQKQRTIESIKWDKRF